MARTILLAACFWFAQLGPASSREVVNITGPPSCAECAADLALEVTLADRPDLKVPIVGSTPYVIRDATGRIFLTHNVFPTRIFEFAADGTFIQAFGSEGQGPGEFLLARELILGNEGELYAFDEAQRRVTVFSADMKVIDTKALPVPPREALFVSDGIVIAGHAYSPDLIGLPLHLFTSRFELVRSFGTDDETARADRQIIHLRTLAPGSEGSIWASRVNRYMFEEWDPASGERRRAFERHADWFAPWLVGGGPSFESPPRPRFQGLWQDEGGLLWTLSVVPDETWTNGVFSVSGSDRVEIRDPERYYDTFIEVIDPKSGTLLASVRVPQFLMGFTNDGLMLGYREPDDDVPHLDLWKASLRR